MKVTHSFIMMVNHDDNDSVPMMVIIIIIIIMGLESVSASEDVIGDLPSPWATINS